MSIIEHLKALTKQTNKLTQIRIHFIFLKKTSFIQKLVFSSKEIKPLNLIKVNQKYAVGVSLQLLQKDYFKIVMG